jgi:hypothetical protein
MAGSPGSPGGAGIKLLETAGEEEEVAAGPSVSTLLTSPESLHARLLGSPCCPRDLLLVSPGEGEAAVHGLVLVAASPLLAACCLGLQPEDTVVLLPGWSAALLPRLVDYVYTGRGRAADAGQREELGRLVEALGVGGRRREGGGPPAGLLVKAELVPGEGGGGEDRDEPFYHFLEDRGGDGDGIEPVKKKPRLKKATGWEEDLDYNDLFEVKPNDKTKMKVKVKVKVEDDEDAEEEDDLGQDGDFKCSHCTKTFSKKRKWEVTCNHLCMYTVYT